VHWHFFSSIISHLAEITNGFLEQQYSMIILDVLYSCKVSTANHTHTRMHARTHARTHTHVHTHTNTDSISSVINFNVVELKPIGCSIIVRKYYLVILHVQWMQPQLYIPL